MAEFLGDNFVKADGSAVDLAYVTRAKIVLVVYTAGDAPPPEGLLALNIRLRLREDAAPARDAGSLSDACTPPAPCHCTIPSAFCTRLCSSSPSTN